MKIIIDIPGFDRPLDLDHIVDPGRAVQVGHGEWEVEEPTTLRDIMQSDVMHAINQDMRLAMTAVWVPSPSCVSFEDVPLPPPDPESCVCDKGVDDGPCKICVTFAYNKGLLWPEEDIYDDCPF